MKLHYEIAGSGPALVLLHPVGLDLDCWQAIVEPLVARHTVLRLDLRGHGRSPAETPGMELADYAEDVHETIVAAGFAPAAVAGLSFGGMIAQTLAVLHPRDLTHLVIAGCPATLPPEGRQALAARGAAALAEGMPALVPGTLQRWFTPAFLEQQEPAVAEIAATLSKTSATAWNQAWQAISQIDTAPRLAEVAVPTLCVAGEHDVAAPPAALSQIASRVQDGRLLVIEGAPHIMQVEKPDAVAAALLDFLAGADIGRRVAA